MRRFIRRRRRIFTGDNNTPVDPHPGNDLLLRDGSSYFLLRDGSSSLNLGH